MRKNYFSKMIVLNSKQGIFATNKEKAYHFWSKEDMACTVAAIKKIYFHFDVLVVQGRLMF